MPRQDPHVLHGSARPGRFRKCIEARTAHVVARSHRGRTKRRPSSPRMQCGVPRAALALSRSAPAIASGRRGSSTQRAPDAEAQRDDSEREARTEDGEERRERRCTSEPHHHDQPTEDPSHGLAPEDGRRGGRSERWSGRRDLNPRPPVPQTGALPDCATPRPCRRCYQTAPLGETRHPRSPHQHHPDRGDQGVLGGRDAVQLAQHVGVQHPRHEVEHQHQREPREVPVQRQVEQ